jgi:hypothetical protein
MWNKLIAIILASGLSFCVQAGSANPMYEVILPCDSQTDQARQQLFKQGMEEVLHRIGTEPELHRYPNISRALESAVDYVQQYAYEEGIIRIQFNPALVRPLIEQTGQTTVSEYRPKVILWLAIEENQQRRLIGQETDPVLQAKLLEMASRRGIPLVLPQMDLEDINAVSTNDIWGQFPSVLQQASQRYGAQMILVGRLQSLGNNDWEAHWQWLANDAPFVWESTGDSLESILNVAFDRMNVQFKDQHVTKKEGASSRPVLIGISNLRSIRDYVQVESYLESLDFVREVNLVQVLGDRVVFQIVPRQAEQLQTLMQAIGFDQHLVSLSHDPYFHHVDMVYRFASLGEGG